MSSSFSTVPHNIGNEEELRRFLTRLVEQLDVAFSNRGTEEPVATVESLRAKPNVSSVGYETEQQNKSLSARIKVIETKLGIT